MIFKKILHQVKNYGKVDRYRQEMYNPEKEVEMVRIATILTIALAGLGSTHNIRIQNYEIPLVTNTYARYRENSSPFYWAPFDSTRQVWDMTRFPADQHARLGIRHYTQGPSPAPESMITDPPAPQVCEFDTLGSGSVTFVYLYLDQYGLFIDGMDFSTGGFRFIGNYRPDAIVYSLPMYYGGSWISAWSWRYEIMPGIFYQANEQHQKRVVAKGKVRLPMSGEYFWPCLVIRDYMVYTDNMGTNDRRWIYEWVVPGHFAGANGVCAVMSQNGAAPDFVVVEKFVSLETCSIPDWDLRPPVFANTRVWRDTNYAGPFVVWSTITDNDMVGAESLFYRVNLGPWVGVGADSQRSNTYYFTIPSVTPPARIDYYIWAMDRFCVNNQIEFWTTWPVCSPESTMITFNVGTTGQEEIKQITPANVKLTISQNPVGQRVQFRLNHQLEPDPTVNIYRTDGTLIQTVKLQPVGNGWLSGEWDARPFPGGIYFYSYVGSGYKISGKLTVLR